MDRYSITEITVHHSKAMLSIQVMSRFTSIKNCFHHRHNAKPLNLPMFVSIHFYPCIPKIWSIIPYVL